jgi:SAM-dependent methyltransferase
MGEIGPASSVFILSLLQVQCLERDSFPVAVTPRWGLSWTAMHPVNKILSVVGLRLTHASESIEIPAGFQKQYNQRLNVLLKENGGFEVFRDFQYDAGDHPQSYMDYECEFAARHLRKSNPATILDIGSHRLFVLGLLAGHRVTTLDVRPRESSLENETIVTSDAKQLDIPSDSFDMVVSLCTLEHFGLGRYGDEFDIGGDKKAFDEMIRVLKPGGRLVFSTTVTRSAPSLAFNAHRIYDHGMIRAFCEELECVEEGFFSNEMSSGCSHEQVTIKPATWDVYCGCWLKRLSFTRQRFNHSEFNSSRKRDKLG